MKKLVFLIPCFNEVENIEAISQAIVSIFGDELAQYDYEILFIDNASVKELVSFAKGLQKDMEAVENGVSSDKSNGFVEGTNSRLKMVKWTMYGRCGKNLLSAKLIYEKNEST